MKIGLQTIGWGATHPDIAGIIGAAAEIGYEGLEIGQLPHVLGDPEELNLALKANGVCLLGLSGGDLLSRFQYSRVAKPLYLSTDEWDEDAFRAAAAPGAPTIALHPHFYKDLACIADAEKCFERDETLRLILDTAHQYLAGDDIIRTIERFRHRIVAIHLRDWTDRYGRSAFEFARGFCPLGRGDLEPLIRETIIYLARTNFDGWVVVEQDFPKNTPRESAEQSMVWLVGLLDKLGRPADMQTASHPAASKPPLGRSTKMRGTKGKSTETADFTFVDMFSSVLLRPTVQGYQDFFANVAETARAAFQAELVAVWENNVYTKELVLLAGGPTSLDGVRDRVTPRATSATGLAIAKCEVQCLPDISALPAERRLSNQTWVTARGAKSIVSIPVFNAYDSNLVAFVIDLFFESDPCSLIAQKRREVDWLVRALGTALNYVGHSLDEEIRFAVERTTVRAAGISSFFSAVAAKIIEYTGCNQVSLFRWNQTASRFDVEGSTVSQASLEVASTIQEGSTPDEPARCLFKNCLEGKKAFMSWERANPKETTGGLHESGGESLCLAAPVFSSLGDVLGVLRCRCLGESRSEAVRPSLSLRLLESFARAIGPALEKSWRLSDGVLLRQVVREVASAGACQEGLDAMLEKTIQTLGRKLRASLGSIYLMEETPNGQELVMRAAIGPDIPLIGKAHYKVGEGITGDIAAKRSIINLKTNEERDSYPTRKNKYNSEVSILDLSAKSPAFLGVPILMGDRVLGIWKVEFIETSDEHPDPYFTQEDERVAQILSSFLAYAIENDRYRGAALLDDFKLFTNSSLNIESAQTEDDAVLAVMEALEKSRFESSMLSLLDPVTRQIKGCLPSGDRWKRICDLTRRDLDGNDILAIVLRTGEPVFIPDSRKDARCDQKAVAEAGIIAQYILPLRLADELIGTLQVDMGDAVHVHSDVALMLQALVGHLAVAISRIRTNRRVNELTENVMSSSRFIAAEELSGWAVHSLRRRLDNVLNDLRVELKRREVRENRFLLETLSKWKLTLEEAAEQLAVALESVKAAGGIGVYEPADVHLEIQKTIDMWITFLRSYNCRVTPDLRASSHTCDIRAHAVRELMSVLLVNSVQAHSKEIRIRSYNQQSIESPPGNFITQALCVEVADNGDGLLTDNAEEVFQPTYTTKKGKLGTGLGLFIARRLARGGGGDLNVVSSSPGTRKGTTFRFVLPVTAG